MRSHMVREVYQGLGFGSLGDSKAFLHQPQAAIARRCFQCTKDLKTEARAIDHYQCVELAVEHQ